MCGLVGAIGKLETRDEGVMKSLLVLDYWRGMDSTGLASVTAKGEVRMSKIDSHPFDLFDQKSFDKALAAYTSQAFIGHNRSATRGKVNKTNTHPFHHEHIVGAHNGTLTPSSIMAMEKLAGEEFGTDSEAIFAAIARTDIDAVAPLLQGAWALTWFNTEDHTFNILKNDQRPLWVAYGKGLNKLWWASEPEMLTSAQKIGKGVPEGLHKDEDGNVVYAIESDRLYTYDVQALVENKDTVFAAETRPLKGKEVPVVSTHYSGGNPFGMANRGGTNHSTIASLGRTPTTTGTPSVSTRLLQTITTDSTDPFGGLVQPEDFMVATQQGCSFCGVDLNWGDLGLSIWPEKGLCLCSNCSTGGERMNRVFITTKVGDITNEAVQ